MASLTELKENPRFKTLPPEKKRRAVTLWLQDTHRVGKTRVKGFNSERFINAFRPDLEEFGVLDKENKESSLKTLFNGIQLATGNLMTRSIRDISGGLEAVAERFGADKAAEILGNINEAAVETRKHFELDEIDRQRQEKPFAHPERVSLMAEQSLPFLLAGTAGALAGSPGGPAGAALGSFTATYPLLVAQGVEDLKKKGFSDEEAVNRAAIRAIPEGIVELLPIARVAGRFKPNLFFKTIDNTLKGGWWPQLKRLLVDSAVGFTEEATQEFIAIASEAKNFQDFIDQVRSKPGLMEVLSRMGEAGLGGAILEPIFGGSAELLSPVSNTFTEEFTGEQNVQQTDQTIPVPEIPAAENVAVDTEATLPQTQEINTEVLDADNNQGQETTAQDSIARPREETVQGGRQLQGTPEKQAGQRALQGNDRVEEIKSSPVSRIEVQKRSELLEIRESLPRLEQELRKAQQTGSPVHTTEANVGGEIGRTLNEETIETPKKKMRKFPKRLATLPRFQKEAKAIHKNARNYYEPQNLEEISDSVSELTDKQLEEEFLALKESVESLDPSNRGVLAFGELLNRKQARGEDVKEFITEQAIPLTLMGQLIRQAGEINNFNPHTLLAAVEATNERQGGRPLTPKQKKDLLDKIRKDAILRKKARKAGRGYRSGMTEQQVKELSDIVKDAERASQDLLLQVQKLSPKKWGEIIQQLIQGNLLIPISFGLNLSSNISFVFLRNGFQTLAAMGDALFSLASGVERSRAFPNLKQQTIGATVGFGRGINTLFTGRQFMFAAGEKTIHGFHPLNALAQAFQGTREIIATIRKRNIPASEKARLISAEVNRTTKFLVEGTLGVSAEIGFRGLTLGDLPFREAARRDLLAQQASLRNLSSKDKKLFIEMPGKKVEELVLPEVLEAVFQQENPLNNTIQFFFKQVESIPVLGKWVQALVVRPIIPYSMTPTNLVNEILQFVAPEYSIARGFVAAGRSLKVKGSEAKQLRSKAEIYFAKAIIGQSMLAAASYLAEAGLLSGEPEKDEKRRSLQWQTLPPGRINISGLKRLSKGGTPDLQEGDEVRSVLSFGFFGMVMNFVANQRARELDPDIKTFRLPIIGAVPAIADVLMDLTVAKGMGELIKAIENDRYEKWFQNYFRVITSIALPNTLAAFNRTRDEFLRDVRPTTLQEAFVNAVKEKNPFFDPTGQPQRRDMLGRPIRRTPEGSSPIMYQMFDVTKKAFVPRDKFIKEIFDVYIKSDRNEEALPSIPDRSIQLKPETLKPEIKNRLIKNKNLALTNEEYDKRQELVGFARRQLLSQLFKDESYQKADPQIKAKLLKKMHSKGSEIGNTRFKIPMLKE